MFYSTSERRSYNTMPREAIKYLTFSRTKRSRGAKGCQIKIPNELSKEARFIAGDRVDVMVDPELKRLAICRVNEGGWTLGSPKTVTHLKTEYTEFPGCVAVSPLVKNAVIQKVEVTDFGIIFDLPESLVITDASSPSTPG